MKTINEQPQELLARYADRTGAKFEFKRGDATWHDQHEGGEETALWHIEVGLPIRLVLTHGLPSHLKPYKENPRDPGEGYRVPAWGESATQEHEFFSRERTWKVASKGLELFQFYTSDYRLPATVMPPDWEEMTREVAVQPDAEGWILHKGNTMPCDGQLFVWVQVQSDSGGLREVREKASEIYWGPAPSTIRAWRYADQPQEETITQPTIGVLRPISEMPDEVPAGCVRYHCEMKDGEIDSALTDYIAPLDTHFVDIQLPAPPDPLAEERTAFETWMKKRKGYDDMLLKLQESLGATYCDYTTEVSWQAWKAAKGL